MSEIGGSEVLLLIIIGLIVLGPERLPRVANQIGSWLGQARRMTRMMRRQLEEEVNFDLKKEVGLDQPANASADKYRNPEFVQDRHNDQPNDDEPNVELPDDYSPAHGADERGTGVGDDPLESPSATAETRRRRTANRNPSQTQHQTHPTPRRHPSSPRLDQHDRNREQSGAAC